MKIQDIRSLEEQIGYEFSSRELLDRALTHSSRAREQQAQAGANGDEVPTDNEQLEFLGDAVLGFVTSQRLLELFPEFREGQLSKIRAHLVSEKHLIKAARQLHLGKYLRLGKGEEKSGGRTKTALQVDALEALLAAIYLDSGLEQVREFILSTIVEPELRRLKKQTASGFPVTDYKSALQELAHSMARPQPAYVLVREEGPEHEKMFTVEARIHAHSAHGKIEYVGRGEGSTKKKAEQDAAKDAFEYLGSLSSHSGHGKKHKRDSVAE